jgi:site-specific recombinase XerD
VKQLGSRAGNWLTRDQARMLLEKSDGESLRCTRDVAMISILLGCGLRRAEWCPLGKKTSKFAGGIGQSWILSERVVMSARFRCRSG